MTLHPALRRLALAAVVFHAPFLPGEAWGQQVGATPGSVATAHPAPNPPPPVPVLPQFNLDFPGGPVGKFIEAVSKAANRQVNVILPPELDDTIIPPMKLRDVTVSALFDAVGSASQRRWREPVNGGPPRSAAYVHGFRTSDRPATQESVWVFFRDGDPAVSETKSAAPSFVVEVMNVTPHLAGRSIEDITTAINTACELTDVKPLPRLTFHKETNLLITRSRNEHLALIHRVLEELMASPPPGSAAAEPAPQPVMSPELMRRYGLTPAPAPRRPAPSNNPAPQ